jgi:hypothetical protein
MMETMEPKMDEDMMVVQVCSHMIFVHDFRMQFPFPQDFNEK